MRASCGENAAAYRPGRCRPAALRCGFHHALPVSGPASDQRPKERVPLSGRRGPCRLAMPRAWPHPKDAVESRRFLRAQAEIFRQTLARSGLSRRTAGRLADYAENQLGRRHAELGIKIDLAGLNLPEADTSALEKTLAQGSGIISGRRNHGEAPRRRRRERKSVYPRIAFVYGVAANSQMGDADQQQGQHASNECAALLVLQPYGLAASPSSTIVEWTAVATAT